ncbi:MAG: acyl-homoserine-lactone synthase [Devosia sp.]|nr:acyl-homoserine-lactone synthase [Devosia sp.]
MSAAAFQSPSTSHFASSLFDLLDRVEYRRVTGDAMDPVYRLRYEAYRREEFIAENPDRVVRDEFDDLPNAYTYGVYIDDRLVSSVRFHHVTPAYRMSPSYSVFTDVLEPILDKGYTILDPGRFTVDYESSLAFPALPFLTLRIPTMAVWHFSVKYCLNSVRPEHGAFYRRVFHSTKFAEARYYHGLSFPMVLYAADIPVIYDDLLRRYPFFRSTEDERQAMFDRNLPVKLVRPTARLALRLAELDAEAQVA